MTAKSKKSFVPYLHVELLQNGSPIARASHKVRGDFRLKMGATKDCELSVPFGPFSTPQELFRCKKGTVRIFYSRKTSGLFKRKNGDVQQIRHHKTEIELAHGDYGWMTFGEFRVIYKLDKTPQRKEVVKSAPRLAVMASPMDFMFASGMEVKAFFASCAAAALLMMGAFLGLTATKGPGHVIALEPSFQLAWVSYEHFPMLPEILQKDLDRRNLLASTVAFVRKVTDVLSFGDSEISSPPLLPSTEKIWKQSFEEQRKELSRIEESQKHRAELLAVKPHSAVLVIPAVSGETLEAKALRGLDKLELLRKAAEKNLALRREFTPIFENEKTYDYTSNSAPEKPANTAAQEALSKIHVFKPASDEDIMYLEAKNFSDRAKLAQAKNLRSIAESRIVTTEPIALAKDLDGIRLAFGDDEGLSERSQKIDRIPALDIGPKKPHSINQVSVEPQEAPVGILEPHIIQKTVAQNRYQLQACYEMALRRNLNTKGQMEWQWQVDPRGKVAAVSLISTTIHDKQMVDCVRSRLAAWRFPRPRRGSVAIKYPFEFKASEKKRGG